MDDKHLGIFPFAETARAFCDWCEGSQKAITDRSAAYWLGRLYAEALNLPEVGQENDWGVPDLPAQGLERAEANLTSFWGRHYREFFDPAPELSDLPGMGDLGDDLMDTYRDIRAGLLLFDTGRELDALWHWSFMHRIHWGRHVASALYALHCLSISRVE
ncbi:hypothetical protein J2W49_001945 [Hydrogenophaga palleronii]|uniref:DUF5063 domain-containing protein n=1 Tax=Hydrogenophaga palleronii TaxID=65655 RepID=A0ABU1WL14_9BURK|nr:DUF5063 domain-containing protein [Hydrogenophaga palleronii]MDR7149990.1 hypothetical protein [Hydrogenophaga palleronii]